MRKIILFLILCVFSGSYAVGQSFTDNFEKYTAGKDLVAQSKKWQLWPSTGQDVEVDNSQAYSGNNSLYFGGGPGPEDVVLPFGKAYSWGHFIYSAKMRIPSGNSAYFNFQADTTPGVTWAVEVSMGSTGSMSMKSGATTLLTANYPQGTWFEIKFQINLILNKWEVLIDGIPVGSFSNSSNRIASLNLYPDNSTNSYWIDDVHYQYFPIAPNDAGIVAIDSPASYCVGTQRNVVATVRNFGNKILDSVTLNWKVNGVTQTPAKYKTKIDTFGSSKPYTAKVTLGKYSFVSAADTIKVWATRPNGKADTIYMNDTMSIVMKPVPPPAANAGVDKPVCIGDKVRIGTTGVTGHKYSWTSNPAGYTATTFNADVSPTQTTTYKLRVISNATGCYSEDSVVIYALAKPIAIVDSGMAICSGDSIRIGAANDTNLTYVWTSVPTGFTATDADPYVKPSATTTYKLVVTNRSGCKDEAEVKVTVNALPQPLAGIDKTICKGESTQIGRPFVNGNSYSWRSVPSGFTSTSSDPTVKPSDTTRYILTTTNTNGCSMVDEVVVRVSPLPAANAGSDAEICIGKSVKIGSAAQTGLFYSWTSKPAGFTSIDSEPTVNPTTTTTYKVVTKNSNNCMTEDSVTVIVVPLPIANAGTSKDICLGETVTLGGTATSGFSYTWTSTPAGFTSTDAQINVSPTENTTYKVTVTNSTGCKSEGQATVTIKPAATANAGQAQTICAGATAQIGTAAVTGNTYSWVSVPAGFTSADAQATVSPTQTTTYKLTVTNAGGCTASSEVKITVAPPTADFNVSATGNKVTFTAANTTYKTYEWNFKDGNTDTGRVVTHTFAIAGNYKVRLTVTGASGCTTTDDSTIVVGNVGIDPENENLDNINLFPNPFSTSTTLSYTITKRAQVNIILTDVAGKKVADLENNILSSGNYTQQINADTYKLKPGIYFIQMQVAGVGTTRKIMKID